MSNRRVTLGGGGAHIGYRGKRVKGCMVKVHYQPLEEEKK